MHLIIAANFLKQMGGVLVMMIYIGGALGAVYLVGRICERIWGAEKVNSASAGIANVIIAVVFILIAVSVLASCGIGGGDGEGFDTDRRVSP